MNCRVDEETLGGVPGEESGEGLVSERRPRLRPPRADSPPRLFVSAIPVRSFPGVRGFPAGYRVSPCGTVISQNRTWRAPNWGSPFGVCRENVIL